jgi:hypothetical protein
VTVTSGRDQHVLDSEHAPTPFTAAEIRSGCPEGRAIRLLVEPADGEPFVRVTRFLHCDESGADQEALRLTISGDSVEPARAYRSAWVELQAHASFPSDRTTIKEETIDIPIGTLDCLRYTVRDGSSVQTFWFATTLPGMPVKFTTHENGRLVTAVTMIGNDLNP